MKSKFIIILLFSAITQSLLYAREPKTAWMLDEHVRITLDALEQCKFINEKGDTVKWDNNELKFIVLSSNLLTDMWDKGQFLTENLYDGLRLGEIFISVSNSVYKIKGCKSSVPDILRQSQDYTEFFNYYIEDKNKAFNYYPDPENRDDNDLSRTKGFHFDNLFSFSEIKDRWHVMNDWAVMKGDDFKKEKGIKKWLVLLGLILHAIQDFYCHSNWVLLAAYEGNNRVISPEQLPTWEDVFDTSTTWSVENGNFQTEQFKNKIINSKGQNRDEFVNNRISGLQTGNCKNVLVDNESCGVCTCDSFRLKEMVIPWLHRHPDNQITKENSSRVHDINMIFKKQKNAFIGEYEAAIYLAARASIYWINKLIDPKIIGDKKYFYLINEISKYKDKINDSFTGCEVDLVNVLKKFDKKFPSKQP